ncbi:30S ribosomal protein S1 [Clostridium tepidiprofundi DSM 19306]|uniref:30S ribosomal protein S1 n=1 Tax=Clostridium tepidiprofundi DSM 19306 TaxID=1121338 RepID=A0A151AXQ4_9CLOT|nr:Tex family protein [Clostridium tepidiprofundi]KYH32428.1 30S ribosomal protein S1 [Clostridium tepidiprofundi DSM 19306]
MIELINKLMNEFNITENQVKNVIEMLDQGNTVPFIARYRKERTGSLDDVILRKFAERLAYIRNLDERKNAIIKSIDEQGKLTDKIKNDIIKAETLTEVEDIYRPFKPKKRTRATIAVEKGLKPLAEIILSGEFKGDIFEYAVNFINEEKKVASVEYAIQGACDIVSETISDQAEYRKWIRDFVFKEGIIEVKNNEKETKDLETTPYEMYYEYNEAVKKIPSHRILAINRGEKEKILLVKIVVDNEKIINYLNSKCLKGNSITDKFIEESVKDSLKRLIYPSIEREIRAYLTEKAETSAIEVFKANLKALLMQPPIKNKNVLGYDPGFRTGCKIAVLDDTGKVLDTATVHATMPNDDKEKAKNELKELIYKNDVDVISLGNGTACRESEELLAELIKEVKAEKGKELYYVIVSEAGASVYSASELASKEYPDINVSLRGAISIARRLQDPLAELVKIDPKALGVGQYQHDVSQKKLAESLTGVVEDCVNTVGVDLNTATPALLSYVSGINTAIAKNIVEYREMNGKFNNRKELKKVKRLGDKAFEQCAGFLRVMESSEPLDNTGVHPESYKACKNLLKILNYNEEDLKHSKLQDIDDKVKSIGIESLASQLDIGIPTLNDIIKEIKKPGRDPREELPKPIFKTGIMELSQLKSGMVLTGTVRNVADFGAFVDIGVHQDGLVHISELSDRFVKHPLDIVKVGDIVEVRVLDVDVKRKRISLSMKK